MIDSGIKHPENRIHLFDPVGLINEGYGGYRTSNYTVRPRRATKTFDNFADTNTNGGLRSYDSFTETNVPAVGIRSYDSFPDKNSGGLRSYDSFELKPYDHSIKETSGGAIRFGVETMEDESDVTTPRLWKPSSPTSPKSLGSPKHTTSHNPVSSSPLHPTSHNSVSSSPLHPTSHNSVNSSPLHPTSHNSASSSPLHPTSKSVGSSPLHPKSVGSPIIPNHQHYNMSPSSRTQAIAKGRREMMDMVRDLPESFYELSLKDIVDQKAGPETLKDKMIDLPEDKKPVQGKGKKEETKKKKKTSKKVKKSESKKKMVRSKSVDNGRFLLKTSVFPIFLGSKKNKKNITPNNSFKIAPMPKPQPASTGSMKGVEKDWWRRRSCISNDSDESNGLSSNSASSATSSSSSSSSSRTNSSNGRRSIRFIPNLCFFKGRRIRGKK